MTVASRTFRSTPNRSASETWRAIVELLTQGRDGEVRNELLTVVGEAASIISDRAPKHAPIVITCDGPRTRIYCVYDEDAVESEGEDETMLGYDPLAGKWRVSLPCQEDDLLWIESALRKKSSRIAARDALAGISIDDDDKTPETRTLTLDPKRFLEL